MTFIRWAGIVFAAHSRRTGPSHLPWLPGTGRTDPAIPRQQLGQHRSSPAGVIVPSPSTFSLGLPLPLCVSAAATEAADSSGQSLSQPRAQSWASPPQPSCGCRLPTEKPSRGWHHRSLDATPSRHLDVSNFSLVGMAGSSFTRFICHTHQKRSSLPLTAFTAAVILYGAIYSTPSKAISVFIAKCSVKNG